jgi:ParB family transcriptional regulator, chromosome partitioning protein
MGKRRLGKGIDALLQAGDDTDTRMISPEITAGMVGVSISRVEINPDQPRKSFSDEALSELTESIRQRGVLQPILVEPTDTNTYRIVAGERRYRAAVAAGLKTVPVLVHQFTENEKLEIALIENIQREDLNPIEEAQAIRNLMEKAGLTQEDVSVRLGMNRSTVANLLRLLKLPGEIREAVARREVSAGHARALLSVRTPEEQEALFLRIRDDGISVREAEALASGVLGAGGASGDGRGGSSSQEGPDQPGVPDGKATGKRIGRDTDGTTTVRKSVELREIEEKLIERLGTRVVIKGTDRKGSIEIGYLSMDDLDRLVSLLLPD